MQLLDRQRRQTMSLPGSSRYFWQVGSRFQDHELTGLHPDVCNLERIGIRIDNPTLLEPNDANY